MIACHTWRLLLRDRVASSARIFIAFEFARAKRRSANLMSEVDENRVTLMDDPRLSNYFASTGASGKNRYGSSRKAARGDKLRAVDGGIGAGAAVGGESSTSDRKKFSRRG